MRTSYAHDDKANRTRLSVQCRQATLTRISPPPKREKKQQTEILRENHSPAMRARFAASRRRARPAAADAAVLAIYPLRACQSPARHHRVCVCLVHCVCSYHHPRRCHHPFASRYRNCTSRPHIRLV